MTSGVDLASLALPDIASAEPARDVLERRRLEASSPELIVGLGGAARHSCVALCANQRIVAACEQERATRVRGAGPNASGLPDEALDVSLGRRHLRRDHIRRFAYAERFEGLTLGDADVQLDHHQAHAAAAFLTSPFADAAVAVFDDLSADLSAVARSAKVEARSAEVDAAPGLSVWIGRGSELTRVDWPWRGEGLVALYAESARVLGVDAAGRGSHLEALARLAPDARDSEVDALFALTPACRAPLHGAPPDSVLTASQWQAKLEHRRSGLLPESPAFHALAAALQARFGDVLLDILSAVRDVTGARRLCLAGSLFYNSYFCGLAKQSRIFDDVFVPINPGDAGLSVGTALHAACATPHTISPFLGPAFSAEEVKATLDNCKLPYEWVGETGAIERAVSALASGYLVGWFDGPMEWGPRALGGRSILASPFSPYVLENLNRFLKHRPSWRSYALSGLSHYVRDAFEGPDASPYMECDYRARDRELVRHVLPHHRASVRIQTVGDDAPPRFRQLLEAFGERTGVPMLVNTSFNGFSEPIVCNPRDAVRVFYGTGLDMLVIDRFVLAK